QEEPEAKPVTGIARQYPSDAQFFRAFPQAGFKRFKFPPPLLLVSRLGRNHPNSLIGELEHCCGAKNSTKLHEVALDDLAADVVDEGVDVDLNKAQALETPGKQQ